jgi:L-amino acid N-acyltransferase YncA
VIRPAETADLPAILDIYNEVIRTSTAVYADEPKSLEDRRAWFEDRRAQHYPVLVATGASDQVLGFSSFGDFRSWPGYRYTVEHMVHVHADARGKGLGTQLIEALFPYARDLGKHVMVAGVDADNAASIALHKKLGFEAVAHFREVGFKFGRWLDLVFLQRLIA